MNTSRLTTQTKQQQIESLLAEEIRSGRYLPGQKLPPLRELAKHFETGFSTVQQAVLQLAEKGLVRVRQGSGVIVEGQHAQLRTADMAVLCLSLHSHVYDVLHALLLERLHRVQRTAITMDVNSPETPQLLLRAAASDPDVFMFCGHQHFPFTWLDHPAFRNKHLISLIGNGPQLDTMGISRVIPDHDVTEKTLRELLHSRGETKMILLGSQQMSATAMVSPAEVCGEVPHFHTWKEQGLDVDVFAFDTSRDPDLRFDEERLLSCLRAPDGPRVIFGLRDIEAWHVHSYLLEHAPELRKEILLIGSGNTPHSRCATPPFPSFDWDLESIADETVRMIPELIRNGDNLPLIRRVAPRLVRLS